MITFATGDVKIKNASVTFGGAPDEAHDAFAERDAAGNVHVTVDTLEPEHGEPVTLVLHEEHGATYAGAVEHRDGTLVFQGN